MVAGWSHGVPNERALMASAVVIITIIIESCIHNTTRKRLFASVPHNKMFTELLEEYHGFPTLHSQIETAWEENMCWTLLPIENWNLTLQSLSAFEIKYLKISCTIKQQDSTINIVPTPTKNTFTVLMAKEYGMPKKRKSR